jgi:hypothetical protein
MYARITIEIEIINLPALALPMPGTPARAAVELLEMIAMAAGKATGEAYLRVTETVIRESK